MKVHLFSLLSFVGAWSPVWGIIGLRGLVTKRPFVLPAKRNFAVWAILMAVLWFLFQFLSEPGPRAPRGLVTDIAFIGFWTIVVVVIARLLPSLEYSAYGVTNASLREGLLASLTKLKLTYEETTNGLRLPAIGVDLQVEGPGSTSRAGSVKTKQQRFDGVLRDIANEMNEYYRGGVFEVNMDCFRLRVLLAVLSAVITGLIFWSRFG